MKIARAISFALYAIAFMMIGSLVYRALFESGGGRSGGFGYGNLWIRYSLDKRGILDPKLESLIATPEMPTHQSYEGDTDKFTFTFANGKIFTVYSDAEHLIWVDPEKGATKVPAQLSSTLFDRIEATRDIARESKFQSGGDFLAWIQKNHAEQAAPRNR